MLIGYARTSTLEQEAGLEAQVRDLKAKGCDKIYQEQTSSIGPRPELAAALDFLREGDTLMITKLDRIARSVLHMGEIIKTIKAKKAGIRILSLDIDTNTATGELLLNVMSSVAQFEREMMLERQREGIAKAKGEGKYKGRAPTAMSQEAAVQALHATGTPAAVIASKLEMSRTSVYRILGNVSR